jgi:hypothetical protein
MQETQDNDEISLKELIGKVQELGHTLRTEVWGKHKLVIVLVTLLTGLGFGFKAYTTKPTYTADLTFILKESAGGGGLNALMGQLSFLGGMGGGSTNADKLLTIALSDNILERVILDTASVNGKVDRIGNHLINTYELQEKWEKDTVLKGFVFSSTPSQKQNRATKHLAVMLRKNICAISFEKKSNVIATKVTVEDDEELALAISLVWYDNLSSYFMNSAIAPQQRNLKMLTAKADSIFALLNGAESSFAVNSDKLGVINMQNKLPVGRSSRNMQMYGTMYGEVIKNKETVEFMLKTSTPSLEVLDTPFAPLEPTKRGTILMLVLGCLAGAVLSVGWFAVRFFFKKITAE